MANLVSLFIGLVPAVAVALSVKEEQAGLQRESTESGINCASHKCSSGWHPKADHLDIKSTGSNADSECCDATCALWTCGPNYLANPAYGDNVGASDQVCCDRTCMDDFQCLPNTTTRGKEARGASVEECCGPICGVFSCTDGWETDASKHDMLGEKPEDCCSASCSFFNCSATPGYVTNDAALHVVGNDVATCCNTMCYLLTCPKDFRMPEEMNETVGNIDTCCVPLCSGFTCPKLYSAITSKSADFGNSTSECCLPTCATYSCSGDWANSTSAGKLSSTNLTDESCCESSCQAYSCSPDWLPKDGVSADAGNSDAVCCDETCALHTCPNGYRKRNETIFNGTRGNTDAVCCEPATCFIYDNRTLTEVAGCNSLTEDDCNAKFKLYTVADNTTNNTYSVACEWWGSKGLPVCRNTGSPLIGCTVSM
eukprot:TRINITY_DN6571_c1_g1_i2.p1 TRINITY_DN6571_c1_g1~~TRINITY_DN6571_c1_g1_i2.p1  ORF type:complete len:457 (+),score=45.20 TRINITY_DN6571_c1_g1_i2:92-1372(+)